MCCSDGQRPIPSCPPKSTPSKGTTWLLLSTRPIRLCRWRYDHRPGRHANRADCSGHRLRRIGPADADLSSDWIRSSEPDRRRKQVAARHRRIRRAVVSARAAHPPNGPILAFASLARHIGSSCGWHVVSSRDSSPAPCFRMAGTCAMDNGIHVLGTALLSARTI